MENLENIFNGKYNEVKAELEKELKDALAMAGEIDFARGIYYQELSERYRSKEDEYAPINLLIYVRISDLHKVNKNKTFDARVTEIFKEEKISQTKDAILKLASLLAHKLFLQKLNSVVFEASDISFSNESVLEESKKNNGHPDFTLPRQILAIRYLLKNSGVNSIDNTVIARFIQFLTNREFKATEIKDTRIYKELGRSLKNKPDPDDLQFVLDYFKKLGIENIVNYVNKDKGKNK